MSEGYTSGQSPSRNWSHGASEQYAERRLVHPSELMDLPLGSRDEGLSFYGVAPSPRGTLRWKGRATPGFIAEHVPTADMGIPSYEQCRRPGEEQYLRPLTPKEVEKFGLEFDPNGYRP